VQNNIFQNIQVGTNVNGGQNNLIIGNYYINPLVS